MSSPTGPFDESQVAQLQAELGTSLDYDDLTARYERLADLDQVVVEVLRIRLADAIDKPTSFTIPGQYSEDRSKSLQALQDRLRVLDAEDSESAARIVPGPWGHRRYHVAPDSEEYTLRRRGRSCGGR